MTRLRYTAETNYLSALRNTIIDMTPSDIPIIVTFLQSTHRIVSLNQLMETEDKLKEQIYIQMNQSILFLIKSITFQVLVKLIQDLVTDRRKIQLACKIISMYNVFMDSLNTWNKRAVSNKTYAHMKTFMSTEYSELDELGGLTLSNSPLDQVNIHQELKGYVTKFKNQYD